MLKNVSNCEPFIGDELNKFYSVKYFIISLHTKFGVMLHERKTKKKRY